MANNIALRGPDMAQAHDDFAWMPANGKILQVSKMRALFDGRVDPDLNGNNLHVVLFQSYGLPFDSYPGTHMPIPTDGVDGWVLDSNNPIESIQEYKRWWHAETGRALIEFRFTKIEDVLTKADYRTNLIGDIPFVSTVVNYREEPTELNLRANFNERIELWRDDNSVPYTQTDSSAIRCAIVTMQFNFFLG